MQSTDSLTQEAVIFSSMEQLNAETSQGNQNAKFFKIEQCDTSAGGYKYAQLTLIPPENYNFDPDNGGYAVFEVSTCEDNFNSSCTFITNYEWAVTPTMYTNISWLYQTGNQVLYVRYIAYNREVPFSVIFTYNDDAGVFGGSYNPNAIGSPYAINANYDTLYQYVKTLGMSQVLNNHYIGFQLSFCKNEQPVNGPNGYTSIATIISDPDYPYSAFNIILCGVAEVGSVDNCRATNSPYAVACQTATSLAVCNIDSTQHNLAQGLFVVIEGEGAEQTGINSFLLSVTAQGK